MKKQKTPDMVTVNRRAHYDYQLGDEHSYAIQGRCVRRLARKAPRFARRRQSQSKISIRDVVFCYPYKLYKVCKTS